MWRRASVKVQQANNARVNDAVVGVPAATPCNRRAKRCSKQLATAKRERTKGNDKRAYVTRK